MTNNMYWISTLIFSILLIILVIDERGNTPRRRKSDSAFLMMVTYGVYFCLQDSFWGLCYCGVFDGDTVLFVASTIFHASLIFTSLFTLNFVLDYLGNRAKYTKLWKFIGGIIFVEHISLVIANLFKPVLFTIKHGDYIPEKLRSVSYINQYTIFFICTVVAFVCIRRSEKESRSEKQSLTALFFMAFTPILAGVFQLQYPEGPFYSMGYFMECFIIYFYILSKDRNVSYRKVVLNAISETYYTMHLFNLVDNSMEDFIESEIVNRLAGDRSDGQAAINNVMRATTTDEYVDHILEFVDFSTLPERLKDTPYVSIDFLGKYNGWVRAAFIALERNEEGIVTSVMYTTQVIDAQKKSEQEMFERSNTDRLTGVYNRLAYEDDINAISMDSKNLVYLSLDVNGLKVVNDTKGHAAGDELIQGAAECMKHSFGANGKVYRIGGDEFAAIVYATENEIEAMVDDFKNIVAEWSGKLNDKLEVSCGYVLVSECEGMSFDEVAKLSDERMYQEKDNFYAKKGIDRRGQAAAHKALCELYTKILKINVTTDSYSIVNMDVTEQTKEKGFDERISEWLSGFGKSGQVHPDDLRDYLKKTDSKFLSDYFRSNKTSIEIFYRRKYGDVYKQVVMEMIPADDYSDDNQSLFLYVKAIDK